MAGCPVIKIEGIEKSFRNKTVLDKVSLDIRENEILGVIGASGAGKTTLLRIIVGFIAPEKGSILFKTKEGKLLKKNLLLNKEIGFATQDSSFYPELTVSENLKYFAALHDMHDNIGERTESVLKLVNLNGEENHPAKNLSDGMKKRLDLACALIHNPRMMILDEPTANIDISLKKQIWSLIKKLKKEGMTIILSSHYLDEIEALCDRIAVIHDKKIAALGTAEELKKKFSKGKKSLYDAFERIANES